MAPAAPQPKRMVMFLYESPNILAILDPIAAPVYTIGASAPTDPPNPIVTELVAIDDHTLWLFIFDSFLETAKRIFVTPCPMFSFITYFNNSSDNNIPTPGYKI